MRNGVSHHFALSFMKPMNSPNAVDWRAPLGLAVLGTRQGATGRVWHLPVSSTGSTQDFLDAFSAAAGRPLKTRHVPRWALRAIGLFVPAMGAMVEMLYQWEEPFIVDDGAFREAFGVEPTPLEQAAAETLDAWTQKSAA